MGKRIEINPGEMFMIAERVILVTERESILAYTGKIGEPKERDRLAYFFTFTGRINNSDEMDEVTIAMSPEDAASLMDDILSGLELLMKHRKGKK